MAETTTTTLQLLIEGNTKRLDDDLARVSKRLDSLDAKGKKSGKGIGDGLKSGLPDISKFGLAAGAAGVAVAGLSKAFEMLLAKEDQLADLSAITGITGKELVALGDSATELSNRFGTSVVENIEAFKGVVSRLGPSFGSSAEAMKIMAEDINILSKASGLDATSSMNALTTAMLQFGISLDDPVKAANTATEMMNIMAAGAKEGAAEIPQLAASLEQVGSTAKSLNIGFDETVAALEVLATKGKYGSEAGIGLRNVLTSLTKPSKEAAEKLKSMGLSADELANVLTEQGLDTAMALLNGKLEELPSLADRASTKVLIFGKENLSSAGAVITGAEAIDSLTKSVKDTTVAFDQSKIKMATTSEIIKRTSTQFMNDVVGGFEFAGGKVGEAVTDITYEIDRYASALSNLFSFDLKGFWGDITTSSKEYRDEQEKLLAVEEKKYQLSLKQANKIIEQQDKEFQRAELSASLNKTLLAASQTEIDKYAKLSTVTDAYLKRTGKQFEELSNDAKRGLIIQDFEKQFNDGSAKTIDEFFLSFVKSQKTADDSDKKSKDDAEKRRQKELRDEAAYQAARIALIADPFQKLSEQYVEDNRLIDVSDAEKRTKDLNRLSAMRKYNAESASLILDGLSPKPLENAHSWHDRLMESIRIDESVVDENESLFDKLGNQLDDYVSKTELTRDILSATFEGIGGSIAGAITDEDTDAMKSAMKSVLNSILSFIEAEWVAAGAAVAIRALLTWNLSAIADSYGFLVALAGVEAARGAINSFDVGSWNIPKTQMAIVHEGEGIIPRTFMDDVRSGNAVISGNNGSGSMKRNRPQRLYGQVDVNISAFNSATKYSQFSLDTGIV